MIDLDGTYWIVDIHKCAEHLSDDEFETLQGLIKKVDLLSEDKNQYIVVKK